MQWKPKALTALLLQTGDLLLIQLSEGLCHYEPISSAGLLTVLTTRVTVVVEALSEAWGHNSELRDDILWNWKWIEGL